MTIQHRNNQFIVYVNRLVSACLFVIAGLAGLYAQPLEHTAKQPVSDLGQRAIRRMILGKGLVVHTFGVQPFLQPFTITSDNWLGGAGNWNSTNWSTGVMPNSSNNAFINNSTPAAVVQLNVSDTINNLTIGSTSVLNFNNNTALTIAGTTITNSNHTGAGGITLNSGGNFTDLIIGSAAVTLTGGGTLTLGNSAANRIYGAVGADVLTNANNTIQGSGQIGAGQMGLVNQGTIDANQATALTIQTTSGTTNTGTLEATAGGNLILDGDTYTNTGGTLLASGSGSVVTLLNATINGGTLSTAGGGVIQASGSPTLIGVTNSGTYQLPNNTTTTLQGAITNSGSIQLNSGGNLTDLILGGAVTLTGNGTVTLDNSSANRIYGAVGADILTNANNVIQGSGQIGAGQMGLVNHGTIDANQATALTIQTTSGTTNTGMLEATAGGNLILDGDIYTNTGGTILASGANSVVTLLNSTINGGTLNTSSGGVIQASGSPTLNGVTNSGTYQLPNNTFTTLQGTITNSGSIQMNSAGNFTELILGSAGVTLTGGGTVTMSNSTANIIFGAAAADVLTNVNNTIQGTGNIGSGQMGLVNQSIIDANQATPLTIQTSNGTTNTGTLEATAGGNLVLSGDTYTNAGGTILASGAGSVVTLTSPTINAGTLSTANGGLILANGNPTLNGVAINGAYQVPNNNNTTLSGTITNTGGIQLNSAGNFTDLIFNGAVTLKGGGTVTLSDSNANLLEAGTGGSLINFNNTISGSGNIGNSVMAFTNQAAGVVDAASAAGNSLTVSTGGFGATNLGLMEASSGGTLQLENTIVNSNGATNGTIEALTGGTVLLNGASVSGGTLTTAGTGVIIAENNAQLDGSTNTITDAANLQVPNNNALLIKGVIQNNGALSLNSGGNNTFLEVNSPTATLQGSGSVILSDANTNLIVAATAGEQLTIAQTIQGPGGNIGDATLVIVNQGTIDATASAHGSVLTLEPDGTFTNNGLLEATGGGSLALFGGTFANTGGVITAGSGSNVTLEGSVTVAGGTLNGSGLFTSLSGTTLNGVTNAATLQVPNNNSTALMGTITNTGSLQLNSGGNFTYFVINGNTTLNGNGTVVLSNSSTNIIEGVAGTEVLTNNGNTIEGSGNIGEAAMGLVNNAGGTILANQPTELFIQPNSSGFTNNGTVQVNTSSTLDIIGPFNNFNSGTGTLTGGTYNVNGGTLQFDNANIVTNAANIILTGAGSQIVSNTNANALANFATNAAGGTFTLGAGRSFTTSGPGGNFTNNGTLAIGSGDTFKVSGSLSNFAGTTLTGGAYYVGGTLQFGASGSQLITNAANLTLAGTGAHLIDLGGSNLLSGFNTNAGAGIFTVAAGGSFSTPGAFTNSGTMDLEQASSLTVSGALTNSGAVATNNTNLQGGANTLTVTGKLTNNSGAHVTIGANNDTSDVANVGLLANAGTVTVDKGAALRLTSAGADTNSGTVAVNGGTLSVQTGSLTNSGTMDLEQKGKLTVTGNLTNNATLTTNNSNLQGGADTITVGGTLTNSSTGHVTIGAHNDTADTASIGILANAGTVTVDKGATVNLTAAGTDTNSGAIAVNGGTLNMQAGAFTNSGTMDLEQAGKLTVTGNLTNSGTLSTNNSNLQGGVNTITVTGTLTNNSGDSVTIGANNDTTDTASVGLLSNAGTVAVGKGAALNLTATGADSNSGSIALSGGTLNVQAGAFTNSGTMDAEQGGKLNVTGGMTNNGALSTNNSNLQGAANTITITGRLTNNTGATVTIGANNDTSDKATVGSLANSGTVTVDTGASLTLSAASTDTNSGAIAVSGALDVKAATTLSGTGSLTLTNGAITGLGVGPAFTNASTIQGSGTISNLGITNSGTLSANQTAPLIVLPAAAGLNNTGTIAVSAGDSMQIGTSAGGALVNFAGNTLTGGTYNLTGTLQFGASGTTLATNAANITLNGSGRMIDFGSHNILAGFNNNAATGVFKLASAASLTTSGGSFLNAGLFTVSAGTVFTVGGSSFNFTQTAGASTVDGTLTSSTLGTLAVNGGSLFGGGTLGYNVVDSGILSPGDSIAKTGKLTVADTYTQSSTGTLDIAIDGAAVGSKYDQLKVTQSATLSGTLNISLGTGFTPTVGQSFTILTASAVSSTFTTVNGLAINSSEHFTITYNGTSVVLKVVSGPLPAAESLVTQAVHPGWESHRLRAGTGSHDSGTANDVRWSRPVVTVKAPNLATASSVSLGHSVLSPSSLKYGLGFGGHLGAAVYSGPVNQAASMVRFARMTPLAPVSQGQPGLGVHGFRPMDQFAAPVALSPAAAMGDVSATSYTGVAPVSAPVHNSMGEMNHLRFECGVDLKAVLKLSRKQLLKGLVASPDSPNALAVGYMFYNAAH